MDKFTTWNPETPFKIMADIQKRIEEEKRKYLMIDDFQKPLIDNVVTIDSFSSVIEPKSACLPDPVGKKKAQWKQEKQFYKRK